MSNFAYLTDVDNLVLRPGVYVTASSSGDYPIANLTALLISKPWRPSTTYGTGWFLLDFGYPVSIDLIALINHNLSSDAVITVTYGSTSACGSTLAGGITWRERDAFDLASSTTSARFWKVSIADPGNTHQFISIGYLMMGDSTTFGTNYAYGWSRTDEYVNAELESHYAAPHIKQLYDRRRFNLPFVNIATANAALLRTLIDSVKRSATPAFFIPDAAVNDGYFGRFTINPVSSHPLHYSYEDLTLEFVEESRGESVDDGQPLIFRHGELPATYDGVMDRDSTAFQMVETASVITLSSAAVDILRSAHHPTLYTQTFLLEGARTNSFTYSEQLDHVNWVKTRASCATTSIDATQAPDGTTTADFLKEDATADNTHFFAQTLPALTNDTNQAFSIYAKAKERSIIWIRTTEKDANVLTTFFNLSTGVIGTQGHATARIVAMGNSWYRCEVVFDSDAGGTTPLVEIGMATADNDLTYDGDNASGCYFWGMQLEVDKPFASSYIKTTTAAATRSTDALYFPITQHPQQLTLYARFVDLGTRQTIAGLVAISPASWLNGQSFYISNDASFYKAGHYNGTDSVFSVLGAAPAINNTVELRATLKSDGKVQIHQSINGAAETSAVESAALVMDAGWASYRIYLSHPTWPGFVGYQCVKLLYGIQNLNTCRAAEYGVPMVRLSA